LHFDGGANDLTVQPATVRDERVQNRGVRLKPDLLDRQPINVMLMRVASPCSALPQFAQPCTGPDIFGWSVYYESRDSLCGVNENRCWDFICKHTSTRKQAESRDF
jgi:hypothetical protein